MTRGFLKTIGASKRLRFVMPGYDAEDMSTPPNKVIFDSDDVGTLAIVTTGMFRFGSGSTGLLPPAKIVEWDLDFIPLCTFQFDINNFGRTNFAQGRPNILDELYINVDRTGITAKLFKGTGTLDVYYTAYRLKIL